MKYKILIFIIIIFNGCTSTGFKTITLKKNTVYIPNGYCKELSYYQVHDLITEGVNTFIYRDESIFYYNEAHPFSSPNFSNINSYKNEVSLNYLKIIKNKTNYDIRNTDYFNLFWREYFNGYIYIGYINVSLLELKKFDDAIDKFILENE